MFFSAFFVPGHLGTFYRDKIGYYLYGVPSCSSAFLSKLRHPSIWSSICPASEGGGSEGVPPIPRNFFHFPAAISQKTTHFERMCRGTKKVCTGTKHVCLAPNVYVLG